MMTQMTIDDLERRTDHAVGIAGRFADPRWYQEARASARVLCRIGNDFTTDDIWELLEHTGLKTHEPRALGAIMRELARDGRVCSTGGYRKSMRKECHRRPLAVWRPVNVRRVVREAE